MVDDVVTDSRPAGPRFGLILALTINGLAVSQYPEMVRVSNIAEAYGFDSIWLCDHFLTTSPEDYVQDAGITSADAGPAAEARPESMALLEGWTALAALARDTTRIRLGTSVLCNSYRHPSVLAKMAETLDVISEGRLDCWWSPEKLRERRDYLEEACAEVGRDPASLRLSVTTLLAPTDSAEQEAQVRTEFASIPDTGLIIGSPQKCIDRINEYRESGIDTFLFTTPHVASSDYLHIAGQEILGAF